MLQNFIMKKSLIILFFISISLIFSGFSVISAQNQKFDSLANKVSILSHYKKAEALDLLEYLYFLAYNSPDSSLLIARCLFEESTLKERHKIVDTIMENKILQRLANNNIPLKEEALLYSALGTNLLAREYYSKSFEVLLKALDKHKLSNNYVFVAKTLNYLGVICNRTGLKSLTKDYYSEAIKWVTPEDRDFYKYKFNFFSNDDSECVVDSLINLLEIVIDKGIEELLPYLYFNIGTFFFEEYPEKALLYYEKFNSIDFDNSHLTIFYLYNMGKHFLVNGDYKKALSYFRNAESCAEAKNYAHISNLYKDIASIYSSQNMNDSSVFYMMKYDEAEKKLKTNIIDIAQHQKEVNQLYEESKNTLIAREKEIKDKNRRIIFISIVSGIGFLLFLFFIIRIYKKEKLKEKENSELKIKIKSEKRALEYNKTQQKKQQEIIDSTKREITSSYILLNNKNDVLKEVKDLSSKIFNDEKDATKAVNKINELIKNSINIDKDWGNYKIQFEKVHPNFFRKLKKLYPKLTEENLKMCVFIKIKMSVKQIAQLLSITEKAVRMSRYRLKKKFKLTEKDSLDDFIGNL